MNKQGFSFESFPPRFEFFSPKTSAEKAAEDAGADHAITQYSFKQ